MATEINNINPYLDSFSFFANKDNLNKKYEALSEEKKIEKSFSKLIEEIKKFIESEDILKSSPQNAFKCLLDNLHRIFRNDEGDGSKIKSAEINRENAFNLFKRFSQKDKSIISEDFFGIKLIEKKCKTCNITNYSFKYLKLIEINVEDNKENLKLNIENCLKKITTTKFEKDSFCTICSENQIHEIKIEIIKFPKIIILIFPQTQKAQFKIKKKLIKQKYKLIGAKIKTKSGESFISDFFKCGSKNNKFKDEVLLDKITSHDFSDDIPLVLFYEKNGRNCVVEDKQDSFFREVIVIDKQDDIISKNNLITNNSGQSSNDDLNEIGKIKGDDNDIFKVKKIKPIILYFKIENAEEKGMFLDTFESKTFKEIIEDLKNKYSDIKFIGNKLYFNETRIDQHKTPQFYKIPSESTIRIKED